MSHITIHIPSWCSSVTGSTLPLSLVIYLSSFIFGYLSFVLYLQHNFLFLSGGISCPVNLSLIIIIISIIINIIIIFNYVGSIWLTNFILSFEMWIYWYFCLFLISPRFIVTTNIATSFRSVLLCSLLLGGISCPVNLSLIIIISIIINIIIIFRLNIFRLTAEYI